MIPNTTTDKRGITTTKTIAALTSTIKDIAIAPNTIKGERKKRRRTRFTPACAWFTSLVIRVTSVELPISSISEKPKCWICSNSACRSPVPNPAAAFAEKYWAVREHISPTIPNTIKTRHILIIYGLSFWAIPLSITAAITRGTRSSKDASSILNSGANIVSFL